MRMFTRVACWLVLTFFALAGTVKAQPAASPQAFESCYTANTDLTDATGAASSRSAKQKQQLINCLSKMPDSDLRKAYLLSQESNTPAICEVTKSAFLPALEACGVELANAQNYREAHATLHAAAIAGSALALGILVEELMDKDGFGEVISLADKAFYSYVLCSANPGLSVNQVPELLYVVSLRGRAAQQLPILSADQMAACAAGVDRQYSAKLTLEQRKEVRSRAAATVADFSVKARAFLAQYPEYRPFNAAYR